MNHLKSTPRTSPDQGNGYGKAPPDPPAAYLGWSADGSETFNNGKSHQSDILKEMAPVQNSAKKVETGNAGLSYKEVLCSNSTCKVVKIPEDPPAMHAKGLCLQPKEAQEVAQISVADRFQPTAAPAKTLVADTAATKEATAPNPTKENEYGRSGNREVVDLTVPGIDFDAVKKKRRKRTAFLQTGSTPQKKRKVLSKQKKQRKVEKGKKNPTISTPTKKNMDHHPPASIPIKSLPR